MTADRRGVSAPGASSPRVKAGLAGALVRNLISAYGLLAPSGSASPVAPRALAWARVSTNAQADLGLSIPQQLREIRTHAQRHGIEIVEEFCETASAFQKDAKRTQFHRMLAAAFGLPSISLILVHDFSRFSRDSLRASALIHELRKAGIRVVSLNDPSLDPETPAGVFAEAITLAKNEAYSREVSFHTRKGQRANVQTRDLETGWCYKNGSAPPLGYRPLAVQRGMRGSTPVMKRLWELDDTIVRGRPVHEWVRYCLVELAGKGATVRELCDFCAETGLPSRSGKWDGTVWQWRLLPRSLVTYAGQAIWGAVRKQKHLPWPPVGWGLVENAHPAIITLEEAAAIRDMRRRLNDGRIGPSLDHPNILAGGAVKCGQCGQSMILHSGYLVCYRRRIPSVSGPCPGGDYYRAHESEQGVLIGLRQVLAAWTDGTARVETVNAELAEAWASLGVDAGWPLAEAVAPSNLVLDLSVSAGPATLAGDAGDAWTACRVVSATPGVSAPLPQIDPVAIWECLRQTEEALSSGSPRLRKLWFHAWLQEACMNHGARTLDVTYALPSAVTQPPNAGAWCAEHSPTLVALLRRSSPVVACSRRRAAARVVRPRALG